MEVIALIPKQYITLQRLHVCVMLQELLSSDDIRAGLFIDLSIFQERNLLSSM